MQKILPLLICVSALTYAKEMIPTPPDFPVLGELEPLLAQAMLEDGGPDETLSSALKDPKVAAAVEKHRLRLFGGPMLGCVTPTSARVWLRTAKPSKVRIDYDGRFIEGQTSAKADQTLTLDLVNLAPGKSYTYRVSVDGEAAMDFDPSFRTPAEAGSKTVTRIAFGGGARYNPPNEDIWDTVLARKPDTFLWLGDNLYQDAPENRSLQRLYYYRRQLRPEFQRLTAQCGNYAIWDDHDFGKNDCAGGPDRFKPDWKMPVWNVFKENWVNPAYGGGPEQPGIWFTHRTGDIEFFMTDGRYYRDYKNGTMLGPVQKEWLKKQLAASTAPIKFLCSGTLWTEHADKGGKDSWWGVKEEREEIFSFIEEQKVSGIILLSADRHRHEVFQIKRPNGYDFYELETSKLTNNHTHGPNKHALFSYNKGNFFGLLTVDSTVDDPTVTFECISKANESINSFELKLSQLQPPE